MKQSPFFRLKPKALILALISLGYSTGALAASAGKVEFSVGNVSAKGTGGDLRSLVKGSEINSGDTILTGSGRAQVRFTDGGFISLSPDTEFKVDEYNYEGKTDGSEKGFFKLVKGGLRAITGAIGHVNKKNYLVNTPVATIGIRGTWFLASMGSRLLVSVGDGAIFVTNDKGDLVLYKGQSGQVNPGTKPQYSNEQPNVNAAGPKGGTPEDTEDDLNNDKQDYIAGNDTNGAGDPCIVVGGCATLGSSEVTVDNIAVAAAWGDRYSSGNSGETVFGNVSNDPNSSASITTDSRGALKVTEYFSFSTTSTTYTEEAQTDVTRDSFGTNGGLGWSRWVGGSIKVTEDFNGQTSVSTLPLGAEHFIWGKPTDAAELTSLVDGAIIADYNVVGYTTPTRTSNGVTSSIAGAVTGNMEVDFGIGSVHLTLGVPTVNNGSPISANGSTGASSGQADFFASGTFGASAGSISASGFFSGKNAAQAGLSYRINDIGSSITGVAAFNQTGTRVGCGSSC